MKILEREIPLHKDAYKTYVKTSVNWKQQKHAMKAWFDNLSDECKYYAFLDLLVQYERKVDGAL
jgi:hypothetical protein